MKRGRTYWASIVPALDGRELDGCDEWTIFINERTDRALGDRRRVDLRFDTTELTGAAAVSELDRNLDLMSWLRVSDWEILSTGFVCWVTPNLGGFAASAEGHADLRPSDRESQ